MRVPRLVSEFIEWRWAPCVGLTAGSLAFVALSLLLIPAQIESTPALADALRASRSSPVPQPRAFLGASLVQRTAGVAPGSNSDQMLASDGPSAPEAQALARQRGFSPVADRPPAAAPEAAPSPPNEPGQPYLQQPEPGGPAREVTSP